jgi:hypothetical protein
MRFLRSVALEKAPRFIPAAICSAADAIVSLFHANGASWPAAWKRRLSGANVPELTQRMQEAVEIGAAQRGERTSFL